MAFQFTQQQHNKQPSNYRDTTPSSGNYHAQISNLEDVSRYPSVYDETFIRNDIGSNCYAEMEMDGIIPIEHHHHHHHHVPEGPIPHPRARVVDFVGLPDGERKMIRSKEVTGVIRSVDDAADGFIKANHKGFGIRQWKTFKM